MESILIQAKEGLKYRQRIGLVGPVVSDYPRLEELLAGLRGLGVGLSVSSMRVKPLAPGVLRELAAGGVVFDQAWNSDWWHSRQSCGLR